MDVSYPLWHKFYQEFPSYLSLLKLHSFIANQLVFTDLESSPNILLYGPSGFPKHLLIEQGLAMYLEKPFPLTKRIHLWSSKLPYVETDAFFEIDMAHPEFPKDIQEMIDFILSIIRHRSILCKRHIIILRNIHILHGNNTQAFRVILERFSTNVLFIATTSKYNLLEPPLLSRMQCYRVPLPTEEENKRILQKLTNQKQVRYIDRNLSKNIFFNEPMNLKKYKTLSIYNYPPIEEFIHKDFSLAEIRVFAYKLFQQGISISTLATDLLESLQTDEQKHKWILEAARIDHLSKLADPSKTCFFIELLLNIYHSYKDT